MTLLTASGWIRRNVAAAALVAASGAAYAQAPRTVLPMPPAPFGGMIGETVADSVPWPLRPVRAPAGAPNILLFMSDDVGFSMSSTFGGPVPTPNFDRLAATGERYNRFHTTGICSPTRAALLTGRNHHEVATGYLADGPDPYPGYNGHFPPSAPTIAQTLRLNGYNTAMFGKHHNVPSGEDSVAGPFDMWPTGLGFEYFYGFVSGDTDQWHTDIVRGTDHLPDAEGPPELLDKRLADDAIRWVHNQQAAAPEKPFFIYYAPGSTHAPHQAPADWIARFKGQFDQGWDKVREETWRRQLALGTIPPGTRLTPRPDGIPAWDSLTPQHKLFAARSMEVAAAMLAYQDAQFGRVVDELRRMGLLDSTLMVTILGDNGASPEGGPRGTLNEIAHINGLQEDDAWLAANVDRMGSADTYENYPVGWAWAMNTPLRWTKQYASMLGAVRNGMIIDWAGHVARPDSICSEFGHVIDIAPTLFDAAQVPAPDTVYGVKQIPLAGQSLLPSLTHCAPDKPRTQYFEIGGKAALYQDGWFASADDGRKPWEYLPPGGQKPQIQWTLYDLTKDFSQGNDVSAQYPDRLKAMQATWRGDAEQNQVFPLDHGFAGGRRTGMMAPPRMHYEFWSKDVSIPAMNQIGFVGRSFTLDADVELDKSHASGVVTAIGSRFGGWSLYLKEGHPTFTYARSTRLDDVVTIAARSALPRGPATLHLAYTAQGIGKGATVELSVDGKSVASGTIARTFIIPAGVGEMLDTGRDTGVTVLDYSTPHGAIEGDIRHIAIDLK